MKDFGVSLSTSKLEHFVTLGSVVLDTKISENLYGTPSTESSIFGHHPCPQVERFS